MKRPDIETAIRIYHEYPEIGTEQVKELYGDISISTATRYKRLAREAMADRDIKTFSPYSVNTKVAYEVWGLDIKDLEHRRKKLISLGMYE